MTILKEIYPSPTYVVIPETNSYCFHIENLISHEYIIYGFYRASKIEFILYDIETFKCLINKLIELNVGVIDIENESVVLYFYNKLKNIKI